MTEHRRLLLAFLTILSLSSVIAKNISEITYQFTTCNATGRAGPSFQECLDHYRSTNSVLESLLNNSTEEQGYIGGQGFVFPRSGYYNITIAGAAGGRGLCSIQGGYGTVLRGRVYIEKGVNDSYLILVGQRGTSPCDTNSSFSLCQNPPSNFDEAINCSNLVPDLDRTGGGGGGGGSMIWSQNATGQYSNETLPLVAAAGGGGTSLNLNYSRIYDYTNGGLSVPALQNQSQEQYYIDWINGQPVDTDGLNQDFPGNVGNSPNTLSAGYGAGWCICVGGDDESVDASLLSQPKNFAQGGQGCSNNNPFVNVSGGFGGGGGACSAGGGGGGYGGGWVVFDGGPNIPGRGGYSLNTEFNGEVLDGNSGDGYVKIFPLDCGCSSGECDIAGDTFECQCPVGRLAGNGFNCITDVNFTSQNLIAASDSETTISGQTYRASFVPFEENYRIYSARVTVSVARPEGNMVKRQAESNREGLSCVVVFVDETGKPVLSSDTITDSNGESEQLVVIRNGNSSFSNPASSLETGQTVAGVIPFSQSNCSVSFLSIGAEIGYSSNSSETFNLTEILYKSNNIFENIASSLLTNQPTVASSSIQAIQTSSPYFSTTSSLKLISSVSVSLSVSPSIQNTVSTETPSSLMVIIGGVVGGLFLVLILVLVLLMAIVIYYRRKSPTSVYQVHSKPDPNTSVHRRGTLQKIRSKFMSLTHNPNYGEAQIGTDGDNFIDLTPTKSDGADSIDIGNEYESLSYSGSKKSSLPKSNRRGGSWKDGPSAGPFRLRSKSRRRSYTLKPKYGIMGPAIDFYEFNSKRPEDDTWEYDRTQLTYLRDIGEGQFGKVLLMKAKNIAGFSGKLPVAVKTLSSIDEEDVKKFMDEVELMKNFCHSNIVSLLGVDSSEGAPLMILEYMPYGDLQNFLKRHTPKQNEASLIGIYHQKKFARDVAMALKFLAGNRYVHRDVAARNCLVGPSLEVKLADFGMARGVHEKDYYRIAGRAVLPVRWMAPESLLYGMFSSASDVWSYGVLLWEIATYGTMPLESLNSQNIVDKAQMQTLSHPWPADACEELMTIKERCHNYEHEKRITFDEIVEQLPPTTAGGTNA